VGLALISVGFAFAKIYASLAGAIIILIAVILLPALRKRRDDRNDKNMP
jgi:hypothetical protein